MVSLGFGIESGSSAYFHTPSSVEKLMFLYPLCSGHFYCVSGYKTQRKQFGNYLLMYIKKGEGKLFYDNKTTALTAGDLVYIDCDKHHTYSTDTEWESVWIHFSGLGSEQYYCGITEKLGNVIEIGEGLISQLMGQVVKNEYETTKMSAASLSGVFHRILCHLYEMEVHSETGKESLYDILQYIQQNFKEELSIDTLCEQMHLSRFYFCRLFKREMGYSPYEYVTLVRLGEAKKLLKTTTMSVKEVAFGTGFHSEANFIRTFKTYADMTPGQFRKMEL